MLHLEVSSIADKQFQMVSRVLATQLTRYEIVPETFTRIADAQKTVLNGANDSWFVIMNYGPLESEERDRFIKAIREHQPQLMAYIVIFSGRDDFDDEVAKRKGANVFVSKLEDIRTPLDREFARFINFSRRRPMPSVP